MSKTSNKQDNFIIKLAKQVDSNTKSIKRIIALLPIPSEDKVNSSKDLLNMELKQENGFSIYADFLYPFTLDDKEFLMKLGQDISETLKIRGVKIFKMEFKK